MRAAVDTIALDLSAGQVDAEKRNDSGAGHRIRTGDIQLGKLTLYQLS